MKNELKIVALLGILCGVCNIIPAFFGAEWYKVMCYGLMGGIPILSGILLVGSKDTRSLRSQSWVNVILGLAIIAISQGTFYAADAFAVLNYLAFLGLCISGAVGLYLTVKRYDLPLVP